MVIEKTLLMSGMTFRYVGNETFRVYVFPDAELQIDDPEWVHVSASGGHRVIDKDGIAHYVPPRWFHLWWQKVEGVSAFEW